MEIRSSIIFIILSIILYNCKDNVGKNQHRESTIINGNPSDSVRIKSMELFGESSEGGNINFVLKNSEVFKINVDLFGTMGNVSKNFSFEKGKLVKYVHVIRYYDVPFYESNHRIIDSSIVSVTLYNRIVEEINQEGKLIDSLSLNKITHQINQDVDKYLLLLNEKK
ncbi:hypothetical protein [Flexithrix dorotheae]|uniref:hypothetical protein n=1 Tax=Flexithrix dorotheae TaxID=70993 RepID=UPI0003824339|nr:hypothetical protein [Flexithrix dorotheae]